MFDYFNATASVSDAEIATTLPDGTNGAGFGTVQGSSRRNSDGFYIDYVYDEDLLLAHGVGGVNYDYSSYDSYSLATGSDATLDTIHADIQLFNVTVVLMYIICFVFCISQKWR